MEKVFWLMWMADVVDGVGFIGLICGFALACSMGFCFVSVGFEDREIYGRVWRSARWLLIPVVVAVLTPSAKTIRVLAVASAADAAVNTALGAKGVEALNAVLDKVIDSTKKK